MKKFDRDIILRTVLVEKSPFLVCIEDNSEHPIYVKKCDTFDDIISGCKIMSIRLYTAEFKRILRFYSEYYVITGLENHQGRLVRKVQFKKYKI